MIFLNKLYTICYYHLNSSELKVELKIDPKHDIYNGHFPSNPITPGVIELEIIKELISYALNKNISLVSLSSCKFTSLWIPQDDTNVIADIIWNKTESDEIKVNATIKGKKSTIMKMSACYLLF